jgi:hypothetical protein
VPPAGLGEAFLGVQHRFRDPQICPAPAKVSAHAFAYAFRVIAGLPFLDQADRAHDLAWRAESALEAVTSDESGLDRMKFVPASDALDREDVGTVTAERQCQARIDPSSVDQDRTRAALATVASLLGSRQVEALTQEIEEGDARVSQRDIPRYAVHSEADGEIHAELRSVLLFNWIAVVTRAAWRGLAVELA